MNESFGDRESIGWIGWMAYQYHNALALAETLKLRGLNREVGVPRPCFGAVAPGGKKLMVTNSKRNKFSLRRPAAAASKFTPNTAVSGRFGPFLEV